MAREVYKPYNPNKKTMDLLRKILQIVSSYQAQGLRLTLRQLYYQLVARALIPNTEKSYKRIGDIVSRARLGGFLDWDAIEDRARRPQTPSEWEDIEQLVHSALYSFRLPRLRGQDWYVELWVEKDALAGVLAPIAHKYHITLMVNRGYSSTSAMRESAERIRSACHELDIDRAHVLYLGDLDPSGEDMVRDVEDRLTSFLNDGRLVFDRGGGHFDIEEDDDAQERLRAPSLQVTKLALTPEQVEEYDPPPNPTKLTDSRAAKFVEEHGFESWEVDALPPEVLRSIIESSIEEYIDVDLMEEIKQEEESQKDRLRAAAREIIQ